MDIVDKIVLDIFFSDGAAAAARGANAFIGAQTASGPDSLDSDFVLFFDNEDPSTLPSPSSLLFSSLLLPLSLSEGAGESPVTCPWLLFPHIHKSPRTDLIPVCVEPQQTEGLSFECSVVLCKLTHMRLCSILTGLYLLSGKLPVPSCPDAPLPHV